MVDGDQNSMTRTKILNITENDKSKMAVSFFNMQLTASHTLYEGDPTVNKYY